MSLIRLIYISAAIEHFSDEALTALLAQSRENNKPRGVTGLLIYKNKTFIQVLEGEQNNVEALFNKIKQDRRHTATIRLGAERIAQRDFGHWYMGFENLDRYRDCELPAYVNILNNQVDTSKLEVARGKTLDFLLSFIK